MDEKAVLAIIEVLGSHPDFNGPLGEALRRHGVDLGGQAVDKCSGPEGQQKLIWRELRAIRESVEQLVNQGGV